jgi:hypothetical protein
MKCTAKAKSTQKRCTRWAMKGTNVCYVHGGPTPKGIAAPNFKHGRYSKSIPDRLSERYQESIKDPEILALREEVALTDARLTDLLSRVDTGESGALWKTAQSVFFDFRNANASGDQDKMKDALTGLNRILSLGVDDYKAWDEVGKTLEQRRKLVESERKRLVDMEQMISVERTMVLLSAVISVIRENVTDRKTLRKISTDIGRLISSNVVQ